MLVKTDNRNVATKLYDSWPHRFILCGGQRKESTRGLQCAHGMRIEISFAIRENRAFVFNRQNLRQSARVKVFFGVVPVPNK